MINVQVVRCKHCQSVITSRANRDFNTCQCGKLSVDGGIFNEETNILGFTRIKGSFQRSDIAIINDFPVTVEDMYEDWNSGNDKYKDLRMYA